MPSFETRGAVLDYAVAGSAGPFVVQLHGLTSSRDRDRRLGLDFTRDLAGYRVLRYDARGHGRSTGTRHPDDYRWASLARDLLALLDNAAPGERVHGVGPSMGTGTLLHAAIADPERFRSLTLLTPPTAWASRVIAAQRYRVNAGIIERKGLSAFLDLERGMPKPPARTGAPESSPEIAEPFLPTVFRGAALADLPALEEVATIAVPVLILAWSYDPMHPCSTAEALRDALPSSELVVARSPEDLGRWPKRIARHLALSR